MRILFITDSLFINGGYSNQLRQLIPRLKADGHECFVFGMFYRGRPVEYDGIWHYGNYSARMLGEDVWDDVARRLKADVILTFKDPYIFEPNLLQALITPWVALAPVDTDPAGNALVGSLQSARTVITLSEHGKASLAQAGIDAIHCPFGYSKEYFYAGDKKKARQQLRLPEQAFIPLFVGQNNSDPSRKNIDNIVIAGAAMRRIVDDCVLFLHTDTEHPAGLDLAAMFQLFAYDASNLRVTDLAQYRSEILSEEYMRLMYQAADVLLAPSTGEGFCVPVIEAQACGLPVIYTAVTALSEVVGSGFKIPVTEDGSTGQWEYTRFGAMRYRASARAITDRMIEARTKRDHPDFKANAVKFVEKFEWDRIYSEYWKPVMAYVFESLNSPEL